MIKYNIKVDLRQRTLCALYGNGYENLSMNIPGYNKAWGRAVSICTWNVTYMYTLSILRLEEKYN